MAKIAVIDLEGTQVGEVEVVDQVFAAEVKEHLLWEVVRYQRAAKRRGTASTKERDQVHRTGAKLYKQKGTGNARHGSRRVNIFRGGGSVFGPHPRDYAFHVNKKVMAGALRSALSLRVKEGNLVVVRDFNLPETKTKVLAGILNKIQAPKALLVDEENRSLQLSARNLQDAAFIHVHGVNVYDILRFPRILITESSIRKLESRLQGAAQTKK